MFLFSRGSASKNYIDDMTCLHNGWINKNAIKDIAFKTLMIMPNLLLQKLQKSSKAKDHLKALKRKLELWNQGNLHELLHEAMTVRKSLKTISSSRVTGETSKRFASLIHKGNVNAAIKLLTNNIQNDILPIN